MLGESLVSRVKDVGVFVHVQPHQLPAYPLADGVDIRHVSGGVVLELVHLGLQLLGQAGNGLFPFLRREAVRGVDPGHGVDDLAQVGVHVLQCLAGYLLAVVRPGQGIGIGLAVADPAVSVKALSFGDLDRLVQAACGILCDITQGLSQLCLVAQGLGIEVVAQFNQELLTMAALLNGSRGQPLAVSLGDVLAASQGRRGWPGGA